MDFKQLEAIVYVNRNGTFKQAAEALYFDSDGEKFITPETIQYRIKQLEQELGIQIYQKRQGSARVVLTREGQLFLNEALDVYQRMTKWRDMFLESDYGLLTFATTQAVLIHRLGDAVRDFIQRYPRIRLRAYNAAASRIEEMVAQGFVDFGLSTRPPASSELDYLLWRRSPLVALIPADHPLAERERVSLLEVAEYPLILLEPEMRGDRELIDAAFRKIARARPRIVMETSNSEIVSAYVELGVGIGILAESTQVRQRRAVRVVRLKETLGDSEVGLLIRQGQYVQQNTRRFLRLLDAELAEKLDARERRLGDEPQ